jgi:hypothetical protein
MVKTNGISSKRPCCAGDCVAFPVVGGDKANAKVTNMQNATKTICFICQPHLSNQVTMKPVLGALV